MGLEQGAVYTLTGPDGHVAQFGDSAQAYFVGYLTEPPAGLDSAEVRGLSQVTAQGDGGYHGNYFRGLRPITLTGIIPADYSVAVINDRIERLQRAAGALRGDAVLTWTESGEAYTRSVRALRLQQPLRITDARPKRFQLQLVSAEHLILSPEFQSATGNSFPPSDVTVTNDGNAPSPPTLIRWTPAAAPIAPVFANLTTGLELRTLAAFGPGQVDIDFMARTIDANGIDQYANIDYVDSEWWDLAPGPNTIRISDSNSRAGPFIVRYRHAWG